MLPLRAASILLWLNGAGFGVFCVPAIRELLAGRGIPLVLGFPAYGRGAFERHGMPTTVPLLAGFLAVCALECVAGHLLWSGQRSGGVLALALLPLGAVFWWGFDLPVPWVLAAARTALIVAAWRGLAA